MMDSPEPSKIKGVSSASNLNATTNTPSSDSPQVQESPFLRFANNLSPIRPVKASHVAHGFLALSSPPVVFKSPRISAHREAQFLERPQDTPLSSGGISHSDNSHCHLELALGEARDVSDKSNYQQSLSEGFITDTQKDFNTKNDENAQNCSPTPSVDEYLADPGDIDQMYSANTDEEQSIDAVSSLNDLTDSKEVILKFDRKDNPSDKAEPLPLSGESSMVHQERPAYVAEPEKIEGEKNDVEWTSQEHTNLESNSAADVFDKQYCHGSHPQCAGDDQQHHNDCTPQRMPGPLQNVEECGNYNEMQSTSQVNAENIPQDDSEASLKYHGIRRRCLQFEEAGSFALGSKKSRVKLSATSSNMKMVPVIGSTSKPSGIGLHLNSIINAMPPGRASTTGVRLSNCLQGIKSTSSISVHKMDNMTRSSISSDMDGQSFVDTRTESHETDTSVAADSFISESLRLIEPISVHLEGAHDKRSLSPAETGNAEELNPHSPCKKKKKTSITADDNGCKRCNCKKSKCLKLYCDCFAAGLFCGDGCACQGCVNKIEFTERVIETRKQIESRNPLAFAPKIVQLTDDVPSNNLEDVNMTTPASARHKRGCNCKRSMCLKKYCECYQAGVGCSSGCRCEGCKNVFGKKEDYVALEHTSGKERESSSVENGSDVKMHINPQLVANKTDLVQAAHHLSPLTPLLKCSDQGKVAAKSRLLSGKYLSSAESDVSMVCNNVNVQNESSPTCGLVSNMLAASYRLNSGCVRQISGSSLRWRSSPITPRTNLCETQHLQGGEHNRLFDPLEDETPDVLKEASTPTKSVKANSPIQKRVSPPHTHVLRIGSSSSGGLRNGRKFILQAVPSFPPLTPCIDSKVNCNGKEDSDNSARK